MSCSLSKEIEIMTAAILLLSLLLKNIHCFQVPLKLPSSIPAGSQSNDTSINESTTTDADNILNLNSTRTPSPSRFKSSLSGGHSTCFKADILFKSATSVVQMSLMVRIQILN